MAIDPKKWTTRTQEAVAAAGESARTNGNPEDTPDHVMLAVLDQPDTVVPPTLKALGIAAGMLRDRAFEAVEKLPKVQGGGEPRMSRELSNVFENADSARKDMRDWLVGEGVAPSTLTTAQFAELVRTDVDKYAELNRAAGIFPQ